MAFRSDDVFSDEQKDGRHGSESWEDSIELLKLVVDVIWEDPLPFAENMLEFRGLG